MAPFVTVIHRLFPSGRPARRGWFALLIVLTAVAVVDSKIESRQAADEFADRAFGQKTSDLWFRVQSYYRKSRHEVEVGMNGGLTLEGTESTTTDSLLFLDDAILIPLGQPVVGAAPTTAPGRTFVAFRTVMPGRNIGPEFEGWTLHLRFVADRLSSASFITPRHAVYNGRGISAECRLVRAIRRSLLTAGVIGCLACLGIIWTQLRYRRVVADLAIASLCVAATAWALERTAGYWVPRVALRFGWHALGAMAFLFLIIRFWPRPFEDNHPRCRKCRYDLTGNESGVCPECGTDVPPAPVERWREAASLMEQGIIVGDGGNDEHAVHYSESSEKAAGDIHFSAPAGGTAFAAKGDATNEFTSFPSA